MTTFSKKIKARALADGNKLNQVESTTRKIVLKAVMDDSDAAVGKGRRYLRQMEERRKQALADRTQSGNIQSAPEAAPAAAPAAIPATAPVAKPRSPGLTFSLPAPLDKENLAAAAAPSTTASHDKPSERFELKREQQRALKETFGRNVNE